MVEEEGEEQRQVTTFVFSYLCCICLLVPLFIWFLFLIFCRNSIAGEIWYLFWFCLPFCLTFVLKHNQILVIFSLFVVFDCLFSLFVCYHLCFYLLAWLISLNKEGQNYDI